MGPNVNVSEQAVKALENMSKDITECARKIGKDVKVLQDAFESNKDGLGVHIEAIRHLLVDLEENGAAAEKPILSLAMKLQKSALIRKGLINNNIYRR